MAVPSSGTSNLSLFNIAKELEFSANSGYDNTMPYSTYTDSLNGATPISLKNMSTGAGGFDSINTANASSNRPDGSAPHNMSEFYSYDHDLVSITQIGSTYSGSYSCSSWQNVSMSVSAYKNNQSVRFIWHYVSGSSYTGDLQIDEVKLPSYNFGQSYWTQTTYSFNTNTSFNNGGFQTNTNDSSTFSGASLTTIASGTASGRFNGKSGGTPSSSTGLSSGYGGSGWYVYAETSFAAGNPSKNFWLVSPYTFLPNYVGTPYFGFRLGRCGGTIGTLKIYIDA